jgi:simple sugar transport system substrate-binding protein
MSEHHEGPLGAVDRRKMLAGVGLMAAAGGASLAASPVLAAKVGDFAETPAWRFVMISHSTTNSFFTPSRYGMEDASALFGVKTQWTGSASGDASEMVNAFNAAIDSAADGIACSMPNADAFVAPVKRAKAAGIPVVSWTADGANTGRLSYIGADNYSTGYQLGLAIAEAVKEGSIVLFCAEPGSSYIVPRIKGVKAALAAAGRDLTYKEGKTAFTIAESISAVAAFYEGDPKVKGMFGLDAYATQSVGQVINDKSLADAVVGGGTDTLEPTLRFVQKGPLKFTIDSQPYLQGFMPIAELFLLKVSGGQTGAGNVDTGIKIVRKAEAATYLGTPSRYVGTSDKQVLVKG